MDSLIAAAARALAAESEVALVYCGVGPTGRVRAVRKPRS
jgi:hypothetical protein